MTINRISMDAGAAGLLDFTPVPRKCERHDGWTPERQRGFIEALAAYGSVTAAAQAVGMSTEGAYHLRAQDAVGDFTQAWAKALEIGCLRLVDVAIERAINGVPVPVIYRGEVVAERRWHDNRLLMFLLRQHMPARYGPLRSATPSGGRTTPGRGVHAPRRRSIEELREGILKKIHAVQLYGLKDQLWTPEKLAAYELLRGPDELRHHKAQLMLVKNPIVEQHPELFEGIDPQEGTFKSMDETDAKSQAYIAKALHDLREARNAPPGGTAEPA